MKNERPLVDPSLARELERLRDASPREHSDAGLHAMLRWMRARGGPLDRAEQSADRVARTIATIAAVDLSLAFSLWAHQMVITYVHEADEASFRDEWLDRLQNAEVVGSTALAAAMACHVTGAALPLTASERDSGLGYLVLSTRDRLDYAELAATIMVTGLLGVGIDRIARWALSQR
ncbi:MAG: hypothetical protein ABSC94_25775 [Polyangiaceae bacterium]|jgi:hypothetical protein